MLTYDPCPRCGRPLVAVASRARGLCTGCTVEADNADPTEAEHLEHEHTCTGPAVVERDTARRTVRTCTTCGAWATRPRVTRWQA